MYALNYMHSNKHTSAQEPIMLQEPFAEWDEIGFDLRMSDWCPQLLRKRDESNRIETRILIVYKKHKRFIPHGLQTRKEYINFTNELVGDNNILVKIGVSFQTVFSKVLSHRWQETLTS